MGRSITQRQVSQDDRRTSRERNGKKVLYCVLGVLCELFRLDTEHGEWDENGEEFIIGKVKSDVDGLPLAAVYRWAGMTKNTELPISKALQQERGWRKSIELVALNDNGPALSFKQMASMIEESAL